MKLEVGGKVVLESRSEVSSLQSVCEVALKSKELTEEEREAAKRMAALMEKLWYEW